jgi:perosamine synthetase
MNKIFKDVAEAIKSINKSKDFIPLHEPTFIGHEKEYLNDCIETGWVSSVGKYVDQFETKLAEYTGVKRAVAVVNGTAALHIALKIAGVIENDEVLMPSLTFVATANAVTYCNAIPHFVDVSRETLGMDPNKLGVYLEEISEVRNGSCVNKKSGNRIKAVVPMHTFGHPVDMDGLQTVCNQYGIVIVEDAAESLGSYYKGIHTGNFGKVSALSFNGNKIITTGGGGAILTNDDSIADSAKHLTTTAKVPHRWKYTHDEIGYNYRLPNINAALGCAQIENISLFIEQKRALFLKYKELFSGFKGITLFQEKEFAKSNYWLNTLILDDDLYPIDEALETLNDLGVMSRPIWTPIHQLAPYRSYPKSDLSITEALQKQIINIPSSSHFMEL